MCPLCKNDHTIAFCEDKKRCYLRCSECLLVFVEDKYLLPQDEEKAIYDLHENKVDDMGYRKFLSRLSEPLLDFLNPGDCGLDFGCGPGPALADMLKSKGFNMNLYDLYYFPDTDVLKSKYDFITSTEVVEHIKDSKALFDKFDSLLNENGVLGLMTKLVIDQKAFSTWHYKNDPTHIRFFSRETFQWIANHWKMNVQYFGNDVIILRKG